ncbi:hypothetical protein D9M71_717710 [compost metagenome]
MAAATDMTRDEAADSVSGLLIIVVEQVQLSGDAFEFQAFVDSEGVKPITVAVADKNRHQKHPPGKVQRQRMGKGWIVIVDSFHAQGMGWLAW